MARGKKTEKVLTPEEKLEQALVPVEEQPYPVPENWCWTQMRWVIESSKEKTEDFSIPDVKYIGLEHIEKDTGITGYASTDGIKSLKNIFHPRQILYGKLRPYLNKHDIATFDGVCSTDILVFNSRKTALPQYINYYFNHRDFIEYTVANSKGINLPRVSEDTVLGALCPLPPLAEQQRIVDRIESLFAKLDEAKEKAQAVTDSFETRKASILHKAFNGELTAKWRLKHNIDVSDWRSMNLQSVCTEKITDGTHKTPIYCDAEKGFPFLSAKDVTSGEICWDNIKYIVPELHEELYARLAPQRDDILLAKNGTTGVAAIVDTDAIFDVYVTLAVLRPNKDVVLPRYLFQIINSPLCKRQFDEHLTGIGVPNLHLRDIKNVQITVPPIDEQAEIVRILEVLLAKEQQAKESAEAISGQIETMKKSILVRAFRGELGTNDSSEKSAVNIIRQMLSEN